MARAGKGAGNKMPLIRANRDLRVDFFRGLALWWIFTDHMPGNVIAGFSLRNYAQCDATEVFVLLAGYGAGLAYGGSMDRHGWLYAAADSVRRSWTLYIAHIFLFVVFSAQVTYSATMLDRTSYLDEIHLDVMADAPYRALLEALTLRFQPAYLNILPIYIVLLAMFALVLPLLRRPPVLLALSFGLYVAARGFDVNLPSWTENGWYFNPLAWQLLFMIGAVLAYAPSQTSLPPRLLDAMAAVALVIGYAMMDILWNRPGIVAAMPPGLAHVVTSVDKTSLHPFRLISILALMWLAARLIGQGAFWLRSRWAAPFVVCGQHSLPVFCAGIFLSFLGRLCMEADEGAFMQIAVNVIGGCALTAVGGLAAWYREKGREPPRRGASAAPAAADSGLQ